MSKIYTRTGDRGYTRLGDGSTVPKNDAHVEACGDVDELNSHLGLLLSQLPQQHQLHSQLEDIQHRLFDLGAELAATGKHLPDKHISGKHLSGKQLSGKQLSGKQWITGEYTEQLEVWIDQLSVRLPELKAFILPGGTTLAAQAHVARSVCRRAERHMSVLTHKVELRDDVMKYINRLSDYLFVAARILNDDGARDVTWKQGNSH